MVFSSAITGKTVFGNKRVHFGTFTSGSTTGGDIDTGLSYVEFMKLQHTGSSVAASSPVINETIPLSSGTVTIVTTSSVNGIWQAEGH